MLNNIGYGVCVFEDFYFYLSKKWEGPIVANSFLIVIMFTKHFDCIKEIFLFY
ncbi:MAG: hypothetical protein JSC188_000901 [Candidatus Tokpelaia sp. JSC188]|nr:MAG: hypothetical protein JSC188_000901 [Candidatus Tokpelaia sp. JSC188]